MKTYWKLLTATALGFGLLATANACEVSDCEDGEETVTGTEDAGVVEDQSSDDDGECVQFKSLKKFVGNTKEADWTYSAGRNLTIDSTNGRVTVKNGSSADGKIETTPFVFRAYDTPDEEVASNLEGIAHGASGSDDITVSSGGGGNRGADIEVTLPSGFNGTITVRVGNGGLDIEGVAGATALDVFSDNGSCDIEAGPTVTNTKVNCDNGSTTVYNVANDVDIFAGNGSLEVALAGVGGNGGTIGTDNGSITLWMPNAGDYSVQATSDSDVVSFGTPPGTCSENAAADNSKTLTCGAGGPNYVVTADGPLGGVDVQYR